MQTFAMQAHHIPPSPTIGKRCAQVHDLRTKSHNWIALLIRKNRAGQQAWYSANESAPMAAETISVPNETMGCVGQQGCRIERIKHRAQHRINRGDLNQSAGHPPNVTLIIEV